jgi:acyl-CoA hydrolase
MAAKAKQKTKLTDAERHKRFVEMAHELETSDDPKALEKAFAKIIAAKPRGRWFKTKIKIGAEGGKKKPPAKSG